MLTLYKPTPALIPSDYQARQMADDKFADLKSKAIQLMRHRQCKEDEVKHDPEETVPSGKPASVQRRQPPQRMAEGYSISEIPWPAHS